MGEKGVLLISKSLAWCFALVAVAIFIAEGLLIGLLNQPECSTVPVPNTDTTKSPPVTKPQEDTTTKEPDSSGVWTNYRLPNNFKPETYEIDLRPVFDMYNNTYWFYGSSKVDFICVEPTDVLLINSEDLTYDADFELTETDSGKTVAIDSHMFYAPNDYIVFMLSEPCAKDRGYTFRAPAFHGELGTDMDGFYRSEYVNEAGVDRVIATSQMETTGARLTFPCFDEPAFKARFTIILRHQPEYKAVSNMPVVTSEDYDQDGETWKKTTFEESVKMSTYLLALTVTDFGSILTKTSKDVETSIYARKSLIDNGDMNYTSIISPQIIDVYDSYFNVFYPLTKSDQMCVPDFNAGAMENWGLVIYREYYLIYNDAISSPGNKYSVTSVIAHELAHQWFGNLVTCSYWNEIWLNEGFATYFSYVGTDGVQPDWKSWELFVTDELQPALSSDSYSSSHPLVHPEGYFSTISYSKGGSFLRMVNEFLGESTFKNGLTNYLNTHSYDVVSHDDLFKAWIDQAESDSLVFPLDLQKVFETWTLQMGYPLITARKTGSKVYLTQEYFLVDPEDSPVDTEFSDRYNYKWYVPITYKTSSNIDSVNHMRAWMDLEETLNIDMASGDNYVLFNIDARGVYRVLYTDSLWTNIKTQLTDDLTKFSTKERAQLLDDAFEISKSGKLDIEEVFELSLYLINDHEYIPWSTYYSGINYWDKMLSSSSIYGEFTDYVLKMALPALYDFYGWEDISLDDAALVERLTRGLAVDVACFYKNQSCIDKAVEMYADWMANPTNLVSSTYRSDVYCTAIRAGGMAEWDFAWDQYITSNSDQHKSSLRYGMSCSQDPWIINRYLERTMNTKFVRLQDSSSTLSYIGRHETSKYVAWAFAANNFEALTSAVGNGAASSLLSAAVGRFSTSYDLKLVEDMREVAGPAWTGTLNSYKASIETNMKWRAANEPKIAAWLGAAAYQSQPERFIIENPTPRHSLPVQKDSPFPRTRLFEKP